MVIKKLKLSTVIISILIVTVVVVATLITVYFSLLNPVDPSDNEQVAVVIESGTAPSEIARILEEKGLVRSSLVFTIYIKLNNVSSTLQAGLHSISPAQSVPDIAKALQSASTEQKIVRFVPGAMLRDNSDTPVDEKQDISTTLEQLGYEREEIEKAFSADYSEYDDTLFKDRPSGAGIEGYVYGETYYVAVDATVEQILRRTFDEFVKQISENNLESSFADQGLTLFEGITLASIVQKEVSCHGKQVCDDQKQVAQVFLKRLREDIPLGADATFVFAANLVGKKPSVEFDSPYNTRIHGGLPPGPISTPGLGSLLAVADPAESDYLYFVSGDDGVTYFSRTEAEHIENTRLHCVKNCSLF